MTERRLRILVVDDNSTDARVVSRQLRKVKSFHADVERCLDAAACHRALAERPPNCVLLDYLLGAETGLDVLSVIREAGYSVPVIMLTGEGDEEIAVAAMKSGAQDYLVKGKIGPQGLQRAISNAVDKAVLERRVREQQEELELFVSVVAHDLKNPICSTLNSTEVLRDFYCSKALDAQGMEFVEASIRSLRRMANLIDRLLEYSQVGRCGRALQELDLADAVRAARANLEAAIDLGTACLEVGKLPRVSGDESALTQLFQNLIANAVKFCNGRPAIVGIRCHGIEDGWQVSVSDNGIGIDPKFHRSIFEPFTRLNTRPTYEGSGIGLATCKRIVEQHGGRIWVESEPGQGATFHFTLPQAPADV